MRRARVSQLWVLSLLCLLWLGPQAVAHDKSVSYSDWSVTTENVIIARIRVPARLTTLQLRNAGSKSAFEATTEHILQSIKLGDAAAVCSVKNPPRTLTGTADTLVFELIFECREDVPLETLTLQFDGFFDVSARHLHFVRAYRPDGAIFETVITDAARETKPFQANQAGAQDAARPSFFIIGVKHILSGPDHILFVLGLILIAGSVRSLLFVVTGFTIGHSISLIAATTGFAKAESTPVEALIALTIWLLGCVALRKVFSTSRYTMAILAGALILLAWAASALNGGGLPTPFWIGGLTLTAAYLLLSDRDHSGSTPTMIILTACLGLAHGFGFAGGLEEAFQSSDALLWPLFAFNLGVEVGQLLIIAAASALALAAKSIKVFKKQTGPATAILSTLIVTSGAFWFIERTIL